MAGCEEVFWDLGIVRFSLDLGRMGVVFGWEVIPRGLGRGELGFGCRFCCIERRRS